MLANHVFYLHNQELKKFALQFSDFCDGRYFADIKNYDILNRIRIKKIFVKKKMPQVPLTKNDFFLLNIHSFLFNNIFLFIKYIESNFLLILERCS